MDFDSRARAGFSDRELKLGLKEGALAFDVDGVVANTMATFLDIVAGDLGGPRLSLEDITAYSLKECLPIPEDIVDLGVALVQEREHTLRTPPFPGAREVLLRLAAAGPVLFVTAREETGPLREWLTNLLHGAPEGSIEVAAAGSASAKPRLLEELGVNYFVEDRLDTCCALFDAGIVPIVFEQPWNLRPHPFPRVAHWKDIARLLDLD